MCTALCLVIYVISQILTCSRASRWQVYARCHTDHPAYGKHFQSRCRIVQRDHQEQASGGSVCSRSAEWCLHYAAQQLFTCKPRHLKAFTPSENGRFMRAHLEYFWRPWLNQCPGCRWCMALDAGSVYDSSFYPYRHACAERRRPENNLYKTQKNLFSHDEPNCNHQHKYECS